MGILTARRPDPSVSRFTLQRKAGNTGGLFARQQHEEDQAFDPTNITPLQRRFAPIVVFLMGRRDAGKTLTMSTLARIAQLRYLRARKPFKIFSNYYLKFAEGYSPHIIDEIMNFPPWARDMYLCIDEIQTAATSRRAMSGTNVALSTFLTMIRKRRIELVFTTQFPQVIDPQILLQVDLFIECERSPDGSSVTLYIHDWWGQYTGENWRKPWPPMRWEADWVRGIGGTDKMFGLYNTEQVIAPMFIDQYARERMIYNESRGADDQEYLEKLPMDDAYEEHLRIQQEQAGAENQEPPEPTMEEFVKSLPKGGFNPRVLRAEAEEASGGQLRRLGQWVDWLEQNGFDVEPDKKWATRRG